MRTLSTGILLTAAIVVGAAGSAGPLAAPPTAPDLTAKPAKVGFGRVTVGMESKGKSITITNRTSSELSLDWTATNAGTPVGFGFSNQDCSALHANSTCTSEAVFHPTAAGKVSGEWTMSFKDAGGQSYSVTFTVSGTGLAP